MEGRDDGTGRAAAGGRRCERSGRPGRGASDWLRHLVVPLVGALVTIAVIVEAAGAAQVVGVVWLGVGLIVLSVQWGRRGTPA
ncbi:hypothetical protein [Streptomyces sp. NPDC058572]|uniref:hypothetical protein n=1 Tax=Streptomyces sp. NPDC058572 TaxID=3346546 RepID=UPI0036698EAD